MSAEIINAAAACIGASFPACAFFGFLVSRLARLDQKVDFLIAGRAPTCVEHTTEIGNLTARIDRAGI